MKNVGISSLTVCLLLVLLAPLVMPGTSAPGVAAAAGLSAAAQPAAQPPADQFVPVKDLPQQEQLPAPMLVIAAYGFVWAALLVYVWSVWRRLGKVEREVRDLASRLGEKR